MDQKQKKDKKIKYPTMIVILLAVSFAFGGATAILAYATGNEVVGTGKLYMVSHTEYRFSEPGQIIARLVDFQGNPVTVNNCTATILYPDKSIFVDAQLMTASTNITGDHYYSFTTPASGPEGVYEYQATCTYAAGSKTSSVTNSFHLSSAFTSVLGNLTSIQSDLAQLSVEIASVNTTLAAEIQTLSNNIGTNFTETFNRLTEINTTLAGLNYSGDFADIQANFTTVLNKLDALNASIDAGFLNVYGNLTSIQNQITSVNTSLSSDISALSTQLTNTYNSLSSQLNDNTSTILTYLTDINDTVNNINIDLSPVLSELERVTGEMLYEDDFNTGVANITTWTAIDGTVANANGYLGSVVGDIGTGALTSSTAGYLNLTDPGYRSLTNAQLLDDVTFEYMYYKADNTGYVDVIFDNFNNYDWYFEDGPFADFAVVGLGGNNDDFRNEAPDINNTNNFRYYGIEYDRWNVVQVHFYDYNSTSGNVSAAAYFNGILFGRVENVVAPTFDVNAYFDNEADRIDNFRIYRGDPELDFAMAIEMRHTQMKLESTVTTVVANAVANLNASMQAGFTAIGTDIDEINVTLTDTNTVVNSMSSVLDVVNTTTTNTYDYLTGTLANNVNTVLSQLGVINETVNRIETATTQINDTANSILQNQQDEVFMTTFSG